MSKHITRFFEGSNPQFPKSLGKRIMYLKKLSYLAENFSLKTIIFEKLAIIGRIIIHNHMGMVGILRRASPERIFFTEILSTIHSFHNSLLEPNSCKYRTLNLQPSAHLCISKKPHPPTGTLILNPYYN